MSNTLSTTTRFYVPGYREVKDILGAVYAGRMRFLFKSSGETIQRHYRHVRPPESARYAGKPGGRYALILNYIPKFRPSSVYLNDIFVENRLFAGAGLRELFRWFPFSEEENDR